MLWEKQVMEYKNNPIERVISLKALVSMDRFYNFKGLIGGCSYICPLISLKILLDLARAILKFFSAT
jgi:hypothetical protein